MKQKKVYSQYLIVQEIKQTSPPTHAAFLEPIFEIGALDANSKIDRKNNTEKKLP